MNVLLRLCALCSRKKFGFKKDVVVVSDSNDGSIWQNISNIKVTFICFVLCNFYLSPSIVAAATRKHGVSKDFEEDISDASDFADHSNMDFDNHFDTSKQNSTVHQRGK